MAHRLAVPWAGRRRRPGSFVADFDSATAFLRATARVQAGRDFPALGLNPLAGYLAPLANALPRRARQAVFSVGGWMEAVPPESLSALRMDELCAWLAGHYQRHAPVPAVLVGSAGGAIVHLAAAIGAPWLPQTVLIPVRQPARDPDDAEAALEDARPAAEALLSANPDVVLHHMHDPVQDRLMLRGMMYFRVKQRRIGPAYETFLRDVLPPGGLLVTVECEHDWPTTRVGPRHLFQFGGSGGLEPDELFAGSGRIAAYLEHQGAAVRRWTPPPPDGHRPEAEWGFAPEMLEDARAVARRHGWRLWRLRYRGVMGLSAAVADLYRRWHAARGLAADRLLAESFILVEPYWALRAGAVPYWMAFNTEVSAEGLEGYLAEREFAEIALMLFSNGVEAVGQAPVERWRAILARAGRRGRFAGTDPRRFPRDFAAMGRYHRAARALGARQALPPPLAAEETLAALGAVPDEG